MGAGRTAAPLKGGRKGHETFKGLVSPVSLDPSPCQQSLGYQQGRARLLGVMGQSLVEKTEWLGHLEP